MRNKVDGSCGAGGVDNFVLKGCIEVALQLAPGGLKSIGGALAQGVVAPMHVAVVVLVVVDDGLNHRTRLLSGRGIVQVDQGPTVHRLLQDGEFRSNGLYVVHAAKVGNNCQFAPWLSGV